jgi:hypothetical protein
MTIPTQKTVFTRLRGRLCQSNKVPKTVISSVAAFTSDLEPKRLGLAIITMQTRA